MSDHVRESHVRSVGKAISWRIVGSIDTFVISLLITGSYVAAGSVASLETVSKVVLYYFHERAWSALWFGRKSVPASPEGEAGVAVMPTQEATCCACANSGFFDTPACAPSIVPSQHTPLLPANKDCRHADVDRD
jgi:uncharacterized membrane protein